jgi:hypothetical protein
MFRTPSGNIYCSVGMGEAATDISCTIIERQGPPAAPRPAGCVGPWGHAVMMREHGPVTMECGAPGSTEMAMSIHDVAEYGVTGTFGGIVCASSREGFECRNADGHGFVLSRARQSVF